jgi:hypothetical protein
MREKIYCADLERNIGERDCFPSKSSPYCQSCRLRKKKLEEKTKVQPERKSFPKMTLNDNYRAVSYIPNYEEEWVKLQDIPDDAEYEASAKRLKEKYNIPRLPTPAKYSTRRGHHKYDPVQVIPQPSSYDFSREPINTWAEVMVAKLARRKFKVENFVIDGRYLQMQVDLTYSIPELSKSFEEKINEWRDKVAYSDRKGRRRKTKLLDDDDSVDHWTVYRLHHLEGKTLEQITADIFKVTIPDIPSIDERFWALYMKVQRAYKKAEGMVKSIIPK